MNPFITITSLSKQIKELAESVDNLLTELRMLREHLGG